MNRLIDGGLSFHRWYLEGKMQQSIDTFELTTTNTLMDTFEGREALDVRETIKILYLYDRIVP